MGSGEGRYSVVKYLPDRLRFEPINIGLVVEFGEGAITRMAEDLDPRIRLADPYADLASLQDVIRSFEASDVVPAETDSVLDWLRDHELPGLYFSAPASIDTSQSSVEVIIDHLYARLIKRAFARPPEMALQPSRRLARRVLSEAFRAEGVFGTKVQSSIPVEGKSGLEWLIDFRFTADRVNLVQTASTSLREDLRRRERGYEALLALLDTVGEQGVVGVLAVDAGPDESDIGAQLQSMSGAYGLDFVSGRRGFMDLARTVRQTAITAPSSQNDPKEQELLT